MCGLRSVHAWVLFAGTLLDDRRLPGALRDERGSPGIGKYSVGQQHPCRRMNFDAGGVGGFGVEISNGAALPRTL